MNLFIFNESTDVAAGYGIGTYIRELTDALRNSIIKINIVNIMSEQPQVLIEEIDSVRIWNFPKPKQEKTTISLDKKIELYYRNLVYLLQLHIEERKDLVFHLNYNLSGKLIDELKSVFVCRIVVTVHSTIWGLLIYDNLKRLRSILNDEQPDLLGKNLKNLINHEKLFFSKADHVISLSAYMYEILFQDYGLDPSKIFLIPNGLTDIPKAMSDNALLREKWAIPFEEKIILFVGRLDELKGLTYLIKAFRKVIMIYPHCRLVIAGEGDFSKYTKKTQDICAKVTYTGLLNKAHLDEFYRLADVGVIPSLFETFGYVAVEMMMRGLPVVVTATSGLDEVVDESNGLKVSITEYPDRVEIDADLLAEKIVYLLEHPKEAKRMGENGRKRYLANYTGDIFRRNMLQLYESLIN